MPDATADCAMAHMVNLKQLQEIKDRYDDLAVVCYINSTAEVKTHSDVCVTSANAVKIVRKLPNQNIFFIPDGNLGRYVAEQVPEKNVMLNDGYCPIHAAMTREAVLRAKGAHRSGLSGSPECTRELLEEADYIGSTSESSSTQAKATGRNSIGTEIGVFCELKKRNPEKQFYTLTDQQICWDMKKITLEKVAEVLRNESNEVQISETVRQQAMRPLERMLELAK